MKKPQVFFQENVREVVEYLGLQIQIGRRNRHFSERALSDRAGVSRSTLRRVEQGDPSVAIGTVFNLARAVGVPLVHEQSNKIPEEIDRAYHHLTLLPRRIRESRES